MCVGVCMCMHVKPHVRYSGGIAAALDILYPDIGNILIWETGQGTSKMTKRLRDLIVEMGMWLHSGDSEGVILSSRDYILETSFKNV